ncbi:unnamed protein product [Dovyalis caffra]|uniref:Uncharacterized protein n=1 Tax=Dovyalis caffra TaxID=77055 RepID=A0AAV1SRA0_9ROSI|nr:unnamed protein product [Dovyalis caffra]
MRLKEFHVTQEKSRSMLSLNNDEVNEVSCNAGEKLTHTWTLSSVQGCGDWCVRTWQRTLLKSTIKQIPEEVDLTAGNNQQHPTGSLFLRFGKAR